MLLSGSGRLFRLESEATLIELASLFTPHVTRSSRTMIDPLPSRTEQR
jgi:hypothetical protein